MSHNHSGKPRSSHDKKDEYRQGWRLEVLVTGADKVWKQMQLLPQQPCPLGMEPAVTQQFHRENRGADPRAPEHWCPLCNLMPGEAQLRPSILAACTSL